MFDPNQLPVPDLGLSCLTCGYPVAGLAERRCPECGTTFSLPDYIPPGDMPPLFADGKAVTATPEVVELFSLHQIPYVKLQSQFDAVLGSYSGTILSQPAPPVGVAREHYLQAIDLMRRLTLDEPLPDPPTPFAAGHDWGCPGCGEENPSNFEVCWSCSDPRA